MSDSDDDCPRLSTESLQALQEFYVEQAEKDEKLRRQLEGKEVSPQNIQFPEDWQLSQFWYDDETAEYLSREALRASGPTGKIALVCCPTLYKKLKSEAHSNQVTLFEFDKRFAIYGEDFISYDYNAPLDIPQHFHGQFDVVVADPPFLSEECLIKIAETVNFLAKHKIILCTGAKMKYLAMMLLNVRKCEFEPHHKNNLANEFYCYTNYDTVIDTE